MYELETLVQVGLETLVYELETLVYELQVDLVFYDDDVVVMVFGTVGRVFSHCHHGC